MTRDLGRLADTAYDVLVVGAGIYGAAIAWDATQRGFSVALVDRGDFGGATSANSLKTVHGGLRSLQRGAYGEMREFIEERRALLRIAPHLVHPLTFVVPTERHPMRGRLVMRAALALNDAIARDRNDGLLPSRRLHAGRLLSRDETLRLAPDLDPSVVTGGASWCDAQMYNSERLVLAFVQSAARAGAIVANHVAVERLLRRGDAVEGASLRDALSGAAFDVRARLVVNAAGPWAAGLTRAVLGDAAPGWPPALSRALNVVTAGRPSGETAVGGRSHGRFFFRVPWRGLTMYGTSHEHHEGPPDAALPGRAAVERLLEDVNRAFPGHPVTLDEVSMVHWGLLPSLPPRSADVRLAKSSLIGDHRKDGVTGLVTVVGVRYTTARRTAEQAVDLVEEHLGGRRRPCATSITPLEGGDLADPDALRREVEGAFPDQGSQGAERLARSYGSAVRRVLALLAQPGDWRLPLGPGCPVTRAEVLFAVREELALTLADALLRRTEAGSAGLPSPQAVSAAADILASELAWSAERRAEEIAALEKGARPLLHLP